LKGSLPLWQRFPDWRFEPCQQIASGFDGAVSVAVMAYALLLFIPLSLALRYIFDAPAGWVFPTGAAAIDVLADWLRRAKVRRLVGPDSWPIRRVCNSCGQLMVCSSRSTHLWVQTLRGDFSCQVLHLEWVRTRGSGGFVQADDGADMFAA
jgi:hypothetical protein